MEASDEPETRLLQHAPRRHVHDHRRCHDAFGTELLETHPDQRPRAFGRVALAPTPIGAAGSRARPRRGAPLPPGGDGTNPRTARLTSPPQPRTRTPQSARGTRGTTAEPRSRSRRAEVGRPPVMKRGSSFRVAVKLNQVVDVVLREPPQHETVRLQRDLHRRTVPDPGVADSSYQPGPCQTPRSGVLTPICGPSVGRGVRPTATEEPPPRLGRGSLCGGLSRGNGWRKLTALSLRLVGLVLDVPFDVEPGQDAVEAARAATSWPCRRAASGRGRGRSGRSARRAGRRRRGRGRRA